MVAPGRKADNLGDFLEIYMESRGGISHCPQFMQGHSSATIPRTNIKLKSSKRNSERDLFMSLLHPFMRG